MLRSALFTILLSGLFLMPACTQTADKEQDRTEAEQTEAEAGDVPITAKSVSTRSLYRKTANEMRIEVPSASGSPIRIETSDGKTTEGKQITLSPSGEKTVLRIYSGEKLLGKKEFAVIDPPRPQLTVVDANGEPLLNGGALPISTPTLEIKVEPDAEFVTSYPEDARYRVKRATVSIDTEGTETKDIGTFSLGTNSTLKRELIRGLQRVDAKPGDQLVVQLKDVVRINHAGEEISVSLNENTRTFAFSLS